MFIMKRSTIISFGIPLNEYAHHWRCSTCSFLRYFLSIAIWSHSRHSKFILTHQRTGLRHSPSLFLISQSHSETQLLRACVCSRSSLFDVESANSLAWMWMWVMDACLTKAVVVGCSWVASLVILPAVPRCHLPSLFFLSFILSFPFNVPIRSPSLPPSPVCCFALCVCASSQLSHIVFPTVLFRHYLCRSKAPTTNFCILLIKTPRNSIST